MNELFEALFDVVEAYIRDLCDILGIDMSILMYAHLAGVSGAATELDYYGVEA